MKSLDDHKNEIYGAPDKVLAAVVSLLEVSIESRDLLFNIYSKINQGSHYYEECRKLLERDKSTG